MIILLIIAVSAIAFAGCTGTRSMPSGGGGPGGIGGGSFATGPTVTLPPGQNVEIQVNEKDPIYATITVIFAGGKGQVAVKDILVRVTTSDGKVTEQHLAPQKGSEVVFQGTRGDDRLEVIVTLNTGASYTIIDRIIPYRTRG
ncbi:MAG: hypothetical protein QHH04_03855 [Methanolinea sp.]|jgi:hypothetical protein|nr:hypothetical protein [Methanolinea sp.]